MIFINEHEIVLDKQERLEAWTPHGRVVQLAMDFIKNCPVDPANGLPWYLQYSCFWTDPLRPTIWPDNPAGKFAWAVTTLLKYYPYSGDTSHIQIVRTMLDRLWEYRTPGHYAWPDVPYASAHPGTGVYFGARADGEFATEPDKVAQVGRAYLDFYALTGEKKYLEIGTRCADVLAQKICPGDATHSPWPFRADVRDGSVVEEYTSHWIPAVRLFEELTRLGVDDYRPIRDQVWMWIEQYPLRNNIWKGHFEDIRIDPHNENRDQVSCLETARYILENRDKFPEWRVQVKGLIDWVRETLGGHPFYTAIPVHEQKYCYFPMGSHTARFACLSALYAEVTGDPAYREQAIRSFNWASYMATDDGIVTVGVDRPDYYNQCWFTDGYFDYVPHFIEGMACLPELAPADSDHMLRSTAVVQDISYRPYQISYRTAEAVGTQKFRLTFQPVRILASGKMLAQVETLDAGPGWMFDPARRVLEIRPESREVQVDGR
ncbi:MAG: hypothetical protein HY781_04465 [Chloroflexi bacterium]|nr:hypothetical protein [Chloroflexota bacterium]